MASLLGFTAAALTSIAVVAQTAASTDQDFTALLKAGKRAEAEALARDRVAKSAQDDVALWYLARLSANDAKKREALIPSVEKCVKDLPQSARCASALGSLYGSAAMLAGITGGLKYAGSIKELLQKAVVLDPKSYDMRRDLIQFYLQAPGIAGGSVRKAIENATEFAKHDAVRGQLLRAEIHVYEKEFAKAESLVAGLNAGADTALAEQLFGAMNSIGFAMVANNEAAKARTLFERQIAAQPKSASAQFGLGRALLELKQVDAAITAMEKARELDANTVVQYRLGIAYQTKGERAKATQLLQQFLALQSQGRAADDARKRIEEMKKG
jgi:tetratricopeptide (TPR) repeat protein